jgi:hypothetical protein
MPKVIPFSGNLSQYGLGPEHIFLEFFKNTVNEVLPPGPPPADDNLNPGLIDNGSSGAPGGGGPGLGIGAGLGDFGKSATADESTTTTNNAMDVVAGLLGNPTTPLGAIGLFGNIALGKNEDPTKMGLRGFVDSVFGFDNPVDKSFEGFAETSDLSMSPTDQSFAGFAETSDAYGGVDSSGSGTGGVGGGGGPGGGNGSDGSSGTGAGSSGDSGPGGGPGGYRRGGYIRYAEGGLTQGPGGGMDDMIPAIVGGSAPAALSDGEFVVPADVVSALGDGSTGAGAKKLYALIKNIREKKFGNTDQPPKLRAGLATLLRNT